MNKQSKWGTAQLAIVGAIDKDVFDTMSLGLTVFPSAFSDPPQCQCDGIGVSDIQHARSACGGKSTIGSWGTIRSATATTARPWMTR
ncbi:hypothetical protein [Polyangium aurulentum]|uniref:hypothetical protein n=1 Tax=Polyangium aurulentum TaxID=2567896 RepID=UPI0010AE8559|nr:hypothetical protein [Polyangium aurulentum]UQA55079.1 hypothetical protein E8A73_027410 [Polyangium aurulentum]